MLTRPEDIERFRYKALESGLKLEILGLKRKGCSAYSLIKGELGYTGSKKEVLRKLQEALSK